MSMPSTSSLVYFHHGRWKEADRGEKLDFDQLAGMWRSIWLAYERKQTTPIALKLDAACNAICVLTQSTTLFKDMSERGKISLKLDIVFGAIFGRCFP